MASLNYNLKPHGDRVQIFAMLTQNGRRGRKYTGFSIPDKKFWDAKKQRLKSTYDKASLINAALTELSRRFDQYVDDCIRCQRLPNVGDALAVLSGETAAVSGRKLVDAFDAYLGKIKNTHSEATKLKYRIMRDQLNAFELEKKKEIFLQDVNEEFYLEFVGFLLESQLNANRTILRKLKFIRTVMQFMVDKKMHKAYDWKAKSELKETKGASRVPLNQEERQALWNFQTTSLQEKLIVDAFLFSMFTGMRYGDLEQLSNVHIFQLEDGNHAVDMSLEKGNKEHLVGIPPFIHDRIKIYIRPRGSLFHMPENGSANRTLQRVSKSLGLGREIELRHIKGNKMIKEVRPLHEIITFHFARYTYTRLMDDSGIQSTWIQKNLRHAKFSTTEGYLKSDDFSRIRETNRKLVI